MHSREEVIDSEIGHHDAQEGKGDIDVVGEWLAEDWQALCMHYHGIYHEGDERPCLLAVPAPIVAPAYVCPDGSDKDAEAHSCEGRVEEDTAQCLQFFAMRAKKDAHQTTDEGQGQQRVAHHDDAHVDAQQWTVQYRHHLSDGWIHLVDVAHQEEEARKQEAEYHHDTETELHQDADEHHKPCHGQHAFVTIRHRR